MEEETSDIPVSRLCMPNEGYTSVLSRSYIIFRTEREEQLQVEWEGTRLQWLTTLTTGNDHGLKAKEGQREKTTGGLEGQ